MNEEETVDVTVCSVYNKWLSVQKHMQKIELFKIQCQKSAYKKFSCEKLAY